MSKKIVVFGLGYVGLSNAVLLAQHNIKLLQWTLTKEEYKW